MVFNPDKVTSEYGQCKRFPNGHCKTNCSAKLSKRFPRGDCNSCESCEYNLTAVLSAQNGSYPSIRPSKKVKFPFKSGNFVKVQRWIKLEDVGPERWSHAQKEMGRRVLWLPAQITHYKRGSIQDIEVWYKLAGTGTTLEQIVRKQMGA